MVDAFLNIVDDLFGVGLLLPFYCMLVTSPSKNAGTLTDILYAL